MQVQNIECQLAKAQMRRFLTGEAMPDELVSDLEGHLKACPECMADANRQRGALNAMLTDKIIGGKPTAKAVVKPKPQGVTGRFVRRRSESGTAVADKAVVEPTLRTPRDVLNAPDRQFKSKIKTKVKSSTAKTLVYSLGLAVVLVLMSTVFKDPTRLFGPKANEAQGNTPPAVQGEDNSSEPVENGSTVEPTGDRATSDSGANDLPEATSNSPAAAESSGDNDSFLGSEVIIADSITGQETVMIPPPKPKPTEGTGTIKVYLPEG
ncbi:MAG: hypothetical protein IH944_06845 [Armatimonadetes bacterium]|nr:hypothetical protein [Armatimonadota bacterium]